MTSVPTRLREDRKYVEHAKCRRDGHEEAFPGGRRSSKSASCITSTEKPGSPVPRHRRGGASRPAPCIARVGGAKTDSQLPAIAVVATRTQPGRRRRPTTAERSDAKRSHTHHATAARKLGEPDGTDRIIADHTSRQSAPTQFICAVFNAAPSVLTL